MGVAITLVIPCGRIGFIKVVDRFVDRVYTASGHFVRRWDRRDALLASQPVATVGLLLLIWLAGFLVGYGLLLWLQEGSLPDALREAGSSLFTLGFALKSGTEPTAAEFLAAASGQIIVALQIAYLPTLYAAYDRRETTVTLLGPRAGSPAWGPELPARAQMVHGVDQLTVLYDDWERWSADVAESHRRRRCTPSDRRACLGPQHDHPARAAAVARPALAWQRAFPGGSGVTCRCRPDDVAQVPGQPACRAWRVAGQIEEVIQVGVQHSQDCGCPLSSGGAWRVLMWEWRLPLRDVAELFR